MCRIGADRHPHGMSANTKTKSEANLDAVGRLYAAYGRGDMGAVLDELADDVDWAAEAAGTAVPWWGPHRGRDDVPRFFEAIAANVDISKFDIVTMTANDEGDVIATIDWSFTVKATGKTASMFMQHWWRFAEGKIAFFRGSEDSAQSAAAFE
jgi:ketosteroid isomerase-like protein